MTRHLLNVVSVTQHDRHGIWHIVLRRFGHRGIDLYLTVSECADYGIDLPESEGL